MDPETLLSELNKHFITGLFVEYVCYYCGEQSSDSNNFPDSWQILPNKDDESLGLIVICQTCFVDHYGFF